MSDIFFIFSKFSKQIKLQSFFYIFLIIIATGLEVVSISMIFPIINIILEENISSKNFIYSYLVAIFNFFNLSINIKSIVLFFSLIYIFKIFYTFYFLYFQESFGFKIHQFISNSLLRTYILKDWSFFTRNNSSEFIMNILVEANVLKSTVFVPLIKIFGETVILLGVITLLFYVSFFSTLNILIFLIIFMFLYKLITKNFFVKLGSKKILRSKQLFKILPTIFSLIREIKILKKEKIFYNYFSLINKKFASTNKLFSITHVLPRGILETFIILYILFSVFNSDLIESEYKSLFPLLGLYLAAAYKILPGFVKIVNSIRGFDYSNKSLKNFVKEMSSKNANYTFPKIDKNKILKINKKIEIVDLSFRFSENSNYIFKNFNLEINKNEIIGIKGSSGKGKSTLVNLIAGLLKPSKGKILVDGLNIHDRIDSWQSNIGIVQQENVLIDSTVKNNITLSFFDDQVDVKSLDIAVRNSNLDIIIKNLENGLDTKIGERGMRLSGGQRQRICIARTLYCNPEVIILDEATNALDLQNEKEILDFIYNIKKTKTIIIVSHRNETLKYCDRVIEI